MTDKINVFDGHNDVALRFFKDRQSQPVAEFLAGMSNGHIDLKKARDGHLVGGLFALFSPSREVFDVIAMRGSSYDLPLPAPLDADFARKSVITQFSMLLELERSSQGAVKICRNTSEIRDAVCEGQLAVVVHMEGAEAIDEDLLFLDILYEAGLRSIGPVWSRHNAFGHGVPLKYPSGPDTGAGLTAAGRRLVAKCNNLGILVDLSHITETGFWDIVQLSLAPLVATHSNVHAISNVARNLTRPQLEAIRDSDGLVGLNFATAFLRPDGQMRPDTPIDWMIRHLDALIEVLGETRVGLGSDFDGAVIPISIKDAAGLPVLFEALSKRGYSDELLRKIAFENWMSVLERTIDSKGK